MRFRLFISILFIHCSCTEIHKNNEGEGDLLWDYDAELKDIEEEREHFKSLMVRDGYFFQSYAQFFGLEDSAFLATKRIGYGIPLAMPKIERREDTVLVSFAIAEFGCHEYVGYLNFEKDTLTLTFKNISSSSCSYFSFYHLEYGIPQEMLKSTNNIRIFGYTEVLNITE
jgi:hypothetical protein